MKSDTNLNPKPSSKLTKYIAKPKIPSAIKLLDAKYLIYLLNPKIGCNLNRKKKPVANVPDFITTYILYGGVILANNIWIVLPHNLMNVVWILYQKISIWGKIIFQNSHYLCGTIL